MLIRRTAVAATLALIAVALLSASPALAERPACAAEGATVASASSHALKLVLNRNAVSTASTKVHYRLTVKPGLGRTGWYAFSDDGQHWRWWSVLHPSGVASEYTLPARDGTRTLYIKACDKDGHLIGVASDSIELDRAAGSEDFAVLVNGGARTTTSPRVDLTLSAKPLTAEVMISNNGAFAGAKWRPYRSHLQWHLDPASSFAIVYVKFRAVDRTVSEPRTDYIEIVK